MLIELLPGTVMDVSTGMTWIYESSAKAQRVLCVYNANGLEIRRFTSDRADEVWANLRPFFAPRPGVLPAAFESIEALCRCVADLERASDIDIELIASLSRRLSRIEMDAMDRDRPDGSKDRTDITAGTCPACEGALIKPFGPDGELYRCKSCRSVWRRDELMPDGSKDRVDIAGTPDDDKAHLCGDIL